MGPAAGATASVQRLLQQWSTVACLGIDIHETIGKDPSLSCRGSYSIRSRNLMGLSCGHRLIAS